LWKFWKIGHNLAFIKAFDIKPVGVFSIFHGQITNTKREPTINETDWRWYSYVAPVSWLTSNDVEDARGHLNFSEWGNLAAHKQAKKTEEIWDEISKDGMPLKIYTLVHPDTKLSGMQKETVKTWAMAGEGMETGSHEEGEKEEGEHEGHNH
jgi:hypothetical protein